MTQILAALEFPPIGHLVDWHGLFGTEGKWYEFNKTTLLSVLAALFTLLLFMIAGSRSRLVPTGVQNIVESGVEFVRDGIIMQTMGNAGLPWLPFLTSMFFFVFFCNIFEVIPGIQFPATARMAIPIFLALLVWVLYNVMGVIKQGPLKYLKNSIIPPGVPVALLPLVMLIEFVSKFLVQPFSLAVRLFANMLAGHLLLVTFAVLSAALWNRSLTTVILPLPFAMLVLMTAFEILVALLQAFIFTILTAVYLDAAMNPHH